VPPPSELRHRTGDVPAAEPYPETGRIAAPPQVLARSGDAVVVLTRLTGQDISGATVFRLATPIPNRSVASQRS
jgi:hypothetical protein